MKRILVLGLGYLSNGEITIAVETLKKIHGKGHELLFVSHANGANYIKTFGVPARELSKLNPKDNRAEFEQIIREFQPDLILCADVYTMDYASPWSGFDYLFLKSLNLPLGSFDQYEWESTEFVWDFMGSRSVNIRKSLIAECDLLLRPCPLNKPGRFDGRIFTVPLFSESLQKHLTKELWHEKLGISKGKKIIFTVNSSWEYVDVTKSIQLKAIVEWMPRILYQYLIALKEPLVVVHVGPKMWDFPVIDTIDYKYFPKLETALYQACIHHADLFLSTNAISITLSNAVYAQTPAILFQNLKGLDFVKLAEILPKMPDWYREMAKQVKQAAAFRMFPWGWTHFLESVLQNNPYTKTFVTAPVFEPQKCIGILQKYLYDNNAIEELKQGQFEYFQSLRSLEPVERVFGDE